MKLVVKNSNLQFTAPRRGERQELNAVKPAASGNSLWVIFTY